MKIEGGDDIEMYTDEANNEHNGDENNEIYLKMKVGEVNMVFGKSTLFTY